MTGMISRRRGRSDSSDSSSAKSVISIPQSHEVIEISSNETEEDSSSFGSEISNSADSNYKSMEWDRKQKQEKELDM